MKLTKQQRCQVYKLALSYLIYPSLHGLTNSDKTMCTAIRYALMELFNISYGSTFHLTDSIHGVFNEFWHNKPKNTAYLYWWDINDKGKRKRIKYLVKMIKLTSN